FMCGMGALLGYWIERGQIEANADLAAILAEHLKHGRRRADEMAVRLYHLVQTLAERNVIPVVLKGTYTARRYFEDPGTRPTADIDFLVSPTEFAPACAALGALGLHPQSIHTRPHREEWGPAERPVIRSIELSHADNPWMV